jgi:RNA polymerase sigma-70 factor (ECF subfamily)
MAPAPPPSDDAALWRRVVAGDEAAMTLLYRTHGAGLYRFVRRMTGSAPLAEDVVQDVFLSVVDAAARGGGQGYDPARGGLRAYLFGAVRKAAAKRLRVPALERLSVGEDGPAGQRSDDDAHAVRCALGALDESFREVVILCELEGLSYEESAAALGVPVGTVRSRLHRARARLAELLGDQPPAAARAHKEAR